MGFQFTAQETYIKTPQQIICTFGPASDDILLLKQMAAICTAIRLNTAHMDESLLLDSLKKLDNVRAVSNKNFAIILDLQGAKVRIGKFPSVEKLPDQVTFFYGSFSDDHARIPVLSENVFSQTLPGDRLLLNDRKIILEVIEGAKQSLVARVIQNGPLSSFKGLNSPDRIFEMARVTASDERAIEISKRFENVKYAISFVADGNEAELFRPLTGNLPLIAKIEQVAAFDHLDEIAAAFSELWLCRGDLGAEAGLSRLGELQRNFASRIGKIGRPCILAGEVLGSMVMATQPSRAEIVQLYDSLEAGFSGLVLSDETACGRQVASVFEFLENFFPKTR